VDTLKAAGATDDEIEDLGRVYNLESGGNMAVGSNAYGAHGIFQFHPDTFARAGGTNINDPKDQARAALNLWRSNKAALKKRLGRDPTAENLYLAHQQGAGGATALLNAPPEINAIEALKAAGVKNAEEAVLHNGGTKEMTAGEFVQKWAAKFNGSWLHGAGKHQHEPGSPDALQAAIDKAQKDADEAANRYTDALGAFDKELDRLKGAFSIHRPGEEPTPPPDLKPFESQPGTDPKRVFSDSMTMLGIIGGMFIHGRGSAALKAGTAAMNAARDRDTEELNKAHQEWVDNTKQAIDNWEAQNKYINMLWTADAHDIERVKDQVNIELQKLGNYEAAYAVRAGQWEKLFRAQEVGNQNAYRTAAMINTTRKTQAEIDRDEAYAAHERALGAVTNNADSMALATLWKQFSGNQNQDQFTFMYGGQKITWSRQDIEGALEGTGRSDIKKMLMDGEKFAALLDTQGMAPPSAIGAEDQTAAAEAEALPAQAVDSLKQHAGSPVTFGNGQTWVWRGGRAARVS
jgi:hypothetical protein